MNHEGFYAAMKQESTEMCSIFYSTVSIITIGSSTSASDPKVDLIVASFENLPPPCGEEKWSSLVWKGLSFRS
jgi:hypothetical protein